MTLTLITHSAKYISYVSLYDFISHDVVNLLKTHYRWSVRGHSSGATPIALKVSEHGRYIPQSHTSDLTIAPWQGDKEHLLSHDIKKTIKVEQSALCLFSSEMIAKQEGHKVPRNKM